MSSKIKLNNFSEGMIPDVDKSIGSKSSYELAENLKLIANKYANSGSLYSVDSSGNISSVFEVNEKIMGHVKIRDYVVIFTTKWINSTTRTDRIRRFELSSDTLSAHSLLWEGTNLYSDTAGANKDVMPELLSVVGRYEDSDNVKVYWANSTRPIRMANIIDVISGYDQERFNLVTTFDIGSPAFDSVVSGSLSTGRVDYAYSLVKENGQESVVSGTLDGNKINLYFDSIDSSSTTSIKGDSEVVNTGKGVRLNVTLSSDDRSFFDKIRLYRIHYQEYAQLPQIVIAGDFTILDLTVNEIVDVGGSGLGEYTAEEFSILSGMPYSAYTIEEKDNVLFAGNVSEEVFDIDFDARAYRFNEEQEAKLYPSYGSYVAPDYTIDSTGFTYSNPASWPIIAEDTNAINAHNDIDNDEAITGTATAVGTTVLTDSTASWTPNQFVGFTLHNKTIVVHSTVVSNTATTITTIGSLAWSPSHTYKVTAPFIYQADGATEGGEGPNLKYSFAVNTSDVVLDRSTLRSNAKTYSGDPDYTDPSIVHTYTTYQRNEIYRFGIVFYDTNGNKSSVKWTGDIRIPGPESPTLSLREYLVNYTIAYPITITFELKKSLASIGAEAWEIVRVVKTSNDKSVVYAGYASSTIDVDYSPISIPDQTLKPRAPYVASPPPYTLTLPSVTSTSTNSTILTFVSPDMLIEDKSVIKEGDYFDVIGEIYDRTSESQSGGTYPDITGNWNAIKYKEVDFRSQAIGIDRYTVDELQYQSGVESVQRHGFTDAVNNDLRNACLLAIDYTTLPLRFASPTGRTVYVQLNSSFDRSSFSNYNLPYVYVKRNNTERYNGSTYQNRINNSYISASSISTSISNDALKGDTYINYVNYMDMMHSPEFQLAYSDIPLGAITGTGVVTFPCESSYNLSLRNGDYFAKSYNTPTAYLMKELAGLYSNDSGDEYQQDKDMYLYNSVYSQEQNIDFDFSESDIELRTDFDSRITHSDKKFDDEYIDSWSKFRSNNFLDLESKHGAIKALKKHNNILYFAQDDAFGVLSVNQRSLISDNNPGQLSLGTGGTLERFDYINEYYGCQHKKSINVNKGGVFFLDKNKKAMLRAGGETFEVLSDSKGFRSIMTNASIISIPFIEGNNKNNEVYWKFDGDNTLVFNTFTNTFISNYTVSPEYIGDLENFTFHRNDDSTVNMFGLYTVSNDHCGSFDNGTSYNDSKLELTNNEEFFNTKTYDNLIFYTSSKDNDIEQNTDIFDSVRFWNDYQYTGVVNLSLGTTLESRERGYALDIPRNIVKENGTTNINIFSASNHDTSRKFKERMRDKYITAELTYANSASKGQLSVPFIGFKYRNSIR